MNVVKILLVLGLGYVALTQKVEKTRNMLLVVTGLLAFCMFSMEGFTITAAQVPTFFASDTPSLSGATPTAGEPQVITPGSAETPIYTVTGEINATADSITGITCKMAATDSANGTIGLTTTAADPNFQPTEASISTMFTCEAASRSETPCPSPAPDPHQCGDNKIYKSDITGLTFTGDQGGANYKSSCCEDGCSDDDCSIFNSGENTKCGDFLGIIDRNCK